MDVVLGPQELEGAGHLLGEMSNNDLVQSSDGWVRVLFYHALRLGVVDKVSALLDEGGQVSEFAEFHDDVHARGRFLAVDEGYYMRVVKTAQDGDLGHEVVLELLVQLVHIDRFDGDRLALFLCRGSG